jgi:hypothetical protein
LIPNHSARYFFWDYIAVVLALGLIALDRKKDKGDGINNGQRLPVKPIKKLKARK